MAKYDHPLLKSVHYPLCIKDIPPTSQSHHCFHCSTPWQTSSLPMSKRSRGEECEEEEVEDAAPSKRCCGRAEEEEVDLGWWRGQLWATGVGIEELLWGWFPFEQADFCCGEAAGGCCCCCSCSWEVGGFDDDIWQIKHITEIPASDRQGTGNIIVGS